VVKTMLSLASRKESATKLGDDVAFEAPLVVGVQLLDSLPPPGKRATLMQISLPLDWRAPSRVRGGGWEFLMVYFSGRGRLGQVVG
jgi:hypothetical protein